MYRRHWLHQLTVNADSQRLKSTVVPIDPSCFQKKEQGRRPESSSFVDRIRDRVARWAKDGDESANDSDIIFSLSSSHITLDKKIGLVTTGRCALAIKTNSGQYFHEMEQEVRRFLGSIEEEFGLNHHAMTDGSGCLWRIRYAKKVEDL